MTVLVDTSAWCAAADVGDRSHGRATARLAEVRWSVGDQRSRARQTWFLASSRLGTNVAETLIERIRSGIARVENTLLSDLEVAAVTATAFPDQHFSIVDRTSWSVMLRLGVHEAVAFDRDFSVSRFGRDRKGAFTVHA